MAEENRSTVGGLDLLGMALAYRGEHEGGEAKSRRPLVLGNEHPETTDKQIFLGVPSSKVKRHAAI